MGFWGVSTIEHHFHSEGYEVGPSPGTLNAYWAAVTKNVRVGQLGYTMSAQNPIRVAEETAILDHLTSGRCFVGFSRGYQARWTNILGQHLGTRATLSPAGRTEEDRAAMDQAQLAAQDKDDRVNRDIFEEQIDLVLEAWGADSLARPEGRWQIPYPYEDGIEWGMKDATARQTQTKTALQDLVDQTEGIDQSEVASQLLSLQNSLQASYQATAMLAQLSLTKFL